MSDALQRPLLLYGIAQENEDEGEDEAPDNDDCNAGKNPVPNVNSEDPHVEEQLTEFERGQGPEIDQCE